MWAKVAETGKRHTKCRQTEMNNNLQHAVLKWSRGNNKCQ